MLVSRMAEKILPGAGVSSRFTTEAQMNANRGITTGKNVMAKSHKACASLIL